MAVLKHISVVFVLISILASASAQAVLIDLASTESGVYSGSSGESKLGDSETGEGSVLSSAHNSSNMPESVPFTQHVNAPEPSTLLFILMILSFLIMRTNLRHN